MRERIMGLLGSLKDRWNALGKGQKIKLLLISLAVLATIVFAVIFISKPQMTDLLKNQDIEVITKAHQALNDAGIYHEVSDNTTSIKVERSQINEAKMLLSQTDVLGGSYFTWANAMSLSGMGATETIKRENIRKAKEGDIARALSAYTGVKKVVVILAIPPDSNLWSAAKKDPSCAIMLTTDTKFDPKNGATMAYFVAPSVEGLDIKNITIMDSNGSTIFAGATYNSSYAGIDQEQNQQTENNLVSDLTGLLLNVYNNVNVVPNLIFDWDVSASETVTRSTPDNLTGNKGLVDSEHTTVIDSTGTSAADAPGLDTNDQTSPTYDMGSGSEGTYSYKETDYNYLYNEAREAFQKTPGTMVADKSSIGIVATNYKIYDQAYMRKNGQLTTQTWEQFKDATSTQYGTSGIKQVVDQEIVDVLVKASGIQTISLMVFEKPFYIDEVKTSFSIYPILMFAVLAAFILMLAYGLLRTTKPDEVTEIEPELSVQDLLVSTQLEEKKKIEADKMAEIEFAIDSEVIRHIERFINEKPEAAALLLRNWLNESWE